MKMIKIGYFADGPWSHQALEKMLQDETLSVSFICARFDKPDSVLEKKSIENGIKFITHPNINTEEFHNLISEFEADIFVSMSFNQIFKNKTINTPHLKTINCHAGKLPFYRGRNIINWALINDEKEFGITVHYMDEGIDTGDIILQECYKIDDTDDYKSILERSYGYCAEILYRSIKIIQQNKISLIKQDNIHPLGFYCAMRNDGDEIINWNQTSRNVFNFIRAICRPGPQARTFINDSEIKLNKAEYLENAPNYIGIPGTVVGVEFDGFFVKTLDSYIKIIEWTNYEKPRIGDRLK